MQSSEGLRTVVTRGQQEGAVGLQARPICPVRSQGENGLAAAWEESPDCVVTRTLDRSETQGTIGTIPPEFNVRSAREDQGSYMVTRDVSIA